MRETNVNMQGIRYPKTKHYLQKLFFRKVFGKKFYKFFKVLKIIMLYKIGKSFEISEFLKLVIKEDFVIFDIGANLGQYAIRLSSYIGKGGKVISVEPVYQNYLFLEKIKKHYNLLNLECLNYAVSDSKMKGKLYIPVIDHDIELDTRATINLENYYFKYDNYKTEEVNITTITDLFDDLKLSKLNIIKSDTEGNDDKVILGTLELIKKYLPMILVEDSHEEKWLTELYDIGYLPYYVKDKTFLKDAFSIKNNETNVKFDLLVLIHKKNFDEYKKYIITS